MTHQQFNIQQLYALPTLYLCVLYLSENKQRIVPLRGRGEDYVEPNLNSLSVPSWPVHSALIPLPVNLPVLAFCVTACCLNQSVIDVWFSQLPTWRRCRFAAIHGAISRVALDRNTLGNFSYHTSMVDKRE